MIKFVCKKKKNQLDFFRIFKAPDLFYKQLWKVYVIFLDDLDTYRERILSKAILELLKHFLYTIQFTCLGKGS